MTLTFVSTHFSETAPIPSDTHIVGQTWAKANKDGSPDRRFQGNYQIPVALYGELSFTTPDGLDVRYLCSDAARAKRLATAWAAFRTSLSVARGPEDHVPEQTNEPITTHQIFIRTFEKYKVAHETFVHSIITPTGKGTLLKEDFMAYMTIVAEFIEAARGYVENSGMSRASKAKYRRAVESFALSRTAFENRVCDGSMDTESFTTYSDAVALFLNTMGTAFNRA